MLLIVVALPFPDSTQANGNAETDFRPDIQSVNIFPSRVQSDTWKNIETLNSQDVGEYSLLQDFNKDNSAFIREERAVRDTSTSPIDSMNIPATSPLPSETTTVPETQSDVIDPSGSTETPSESIEATTVSEPAPQENGTGEEAVAPLESTQIDVFQKFSYARPFKVVTGNFLFAQAALIDDVSVSEPNVQEAPHDEENNESVSEPAAHTDAEVSTIDDVVESNEFEAVVSPSESEGEVLGDDTEIIQGSESDTNDSDTVSSDSVVHDESLATRDAYKIELSDFGMPMLASGQFIDNLQLRLSLAGQYNLGNLSAYPSIEVTYSFGGFERDAGSIIVEEEISNALNGGYFLIPLPSITDPALLSDLTITIAFVGDTTHLSSLYIDSAWLELGTVVFDKELLKERFSTDEMLKHLDGLESMELLSDRLDFLRDELPQFNLRYTSQRNFLIQAFRSFLGKDLAFVESATFMSSNDEPVGISPQVTVTSDGLVSIVVDETDKERLKPGVYTLEVVINEGGYISTDSFQFQWGLLSINSNQTAYSPNDVVALSMGALSPNGNTLCDANLNLYITDASGFISNPPVVASGQCFGNNVTDTPDFSAQYIAGLPGVYEMYLERVDESGNVISHTTDTFLVTENQQFAIERNGPTRIYPPAMYPMELTVHALRSSFEGELIERVPNNFHIFNTDAEIREQGEYTELVWALSVEAGTSQTVSYDFDAPDLSPYLYELGPAQLAGVAQPDPSLQGSTVSPDAQIPDVLIEDGEPVSEQVVDIVTAPVSDPSEVPPTDAPAVAPEAVISDIPPPVIEEGQAVPAAEEVSPVAAPPVTETPESVAAPDSVPVSPDTNQVPESMPEAFLGGTSYISLFKPAVGNFEFTQAQTSTPVVPDANSAELTEPFSEVVVTPPTQEVDDVEEDIVTVPTVPESGIDETTEATSSVVFMEHRQWQIASDATGNMILFWDNASTIPSGWTCLSCGSGAFFQNFAQGNSTYNTTGGLATHVHTASGAASTSALATIAAGGSGTTAITAHTHTLSPTIASTSSLPSYRQLRVIQYTDAAGEPPQLPAGAIGIFDVASSSLPSGWTRYAAHDGYYIRGEDTPGTTGGANVNRHNVTGTTGNAAGGTTGAGAGATGATAAHNHTVSTTTDLVSNQPPYIEVLLGKITATSAPPNSLIAMWSDTVPTGWTDVSSGGGDPFNSRFLKASTTYGATGGTSNHTHANINNASTSAPSATVTDAGGAVGASNVHTHRFNVTGFSNTSHLPPYVTAIFGRRADFTPWYTQTSSRWYVNADAQTPTDPWPLGGTNLVETESITATSSPVDAGEVVRLRMNATVSNASSSAGATFLLQYGEATSTCASIVSWTNVGTSTSNAVWRGYDNATPADHGTISSRLLGASAVSATYEENGYATVTPSAIPVTSVGEWDFVLQNNGATPGTNYCFRMVEGDTSPFLAYTSYPKLITNQAPSTTASVAPFDNEKTGTTTTQFSFVAADTESDRLEYELTIDDTFDFSSPVLTKQSSDYPTDAGWASSTFAAGATTTYTIQPADALTDGTTYWWRVRARDTLGSNTWGTTSVIRSVTVDTSLDVSAWYQTLGLQFEDGTLANVSTTTGTVVLSTTTTSVPTVMSGWSVATASPGTSIILTKPSNVEAGDLLLILVGNDDNTATAQWNNTTLKPTGFTLINEAGNATADAHVAAFYRVADGTESATTSVPAQISADYWGYYIRVTGASTTNPINVTGADYLGAAAATHAVTSVTTTVANTLAFYILSGDGADMYPFSAAGTGWSESAEVFAGAGGTESSGTWGTRSMVTAGATGAVTVTPSVTDSASGFQFAINPSRARGTIMSSEIDFDSVAGQTDWGDVNWSVTEPSNTNTKMRVFYSSTTTCDTIVPDSALAGNSAGFSTTSSGFFISSLSTTTYNRLCLKMTLDVGMGTTSPTLNDWTVGWVVPNQVPATPNLADTPAFSFAKSTTTTPTLGGFASTDYENNSLEYEIIIDDTYGLTSPVLTKRSSDYPTDAGWNATTFTAGATTTYSIQSADALTLGTTYWWAVRARDPLGTNTWSATSTARSITIGAGNTIPEWHQTTDAQFNFNAFNNATTSGDGIEIETLGVAATNITTQSVWSQQYASAAYPTTTINASYSVGAGSDRVLVVAIASTRSTAGTQSVNVYYGGQALTLAAGDASNATNPNHSYLYYLNDAGIAAATTTQLSVTVSGGTAQYTYVYASVFAGVDQTSIYTDARNYFSAAASATVGPFSAGLTVGTGDQAIEIVNLARSTVGTSAARTVTAWSNATWPGPSTIATTFPATANWGLGLHINNRNATTSGTQASGHTANSANTFDSMTGMSLKVAGSGSSGSATSTIIDHDSVPNQSTWGEIGWEVTEPSGSDSFMHVYYATTSTSSCTTRIPDVALAGNAAGFDAGQSPLTISGLSTSTYNRICLVIDFTQGSAVSSPVLSDWTVRWVRAPQFVQSDYQWYVNVDSLTPTDPWPVGGTDLDENEAIDTDSGILTDEAIRLRMSLTGTSTNAAIGSASFKLQFAEGATCSAGLDWYSVGDTASTTALWRGYNNPTVADATILPTLLLASSTVLESYEERNDSYPNLTAINVGEVAEWDWTLYNDLGVAGASYCFRLVNADGSVLSSYTNYPTLVTNDSPDAPVLDAPFDNEKLASTSPWFDFMSTDIEGNELDFQIQIDDDFAFGSAVIDTDSESNLDDFINIATPADKSPFDNAVAMRYIIPSALSNGTTYWWRMRAKDVNGSNSYGEWSTAQSFTVDTSVTLTTWFQTTEAQFDTDTLEGTNATAGNLVSFASGSTTGTTTSSAIDFADATTGNAWGSFSFTETGAANDILYHIEYFSDGEWALVPDSALSGNAAGYDSSPVDLIDLDTATYDILRIRANFRAGSPTLTDWTVVWGERVSVVTHTDPFDNEKFSTTSPTFTFSTTDPQNDELEYEISWSTDQSFASGTTTINSSSSPTGFVNLTTGADILSPFISGDTISYKVQPANVLTASTTYWWRARAKDPNGSGSYSFWSDPWSFTTATSGESISVSTWYQTLGLQFERGTLTGVSTSTGSVGIGGGITVESGWTSNTAVPNSSLTLTKPSGIEAGDLLLILVGNDDNTATAQWNNTTLKPSGFTLINEAGNATPDAHVAAFYRVADGSEGTTISVPAQSSDDYWGYYIRVTGVDTSSPIDVTGADYAVDILLSHPITGVTTVTDQAVAFYVMSADGGDNDPFTVSGTGWVESAEVEAGAGAGNVAGTWGTRAMATAGATGAATVAMALVDGASGFQFALKPAPIAAGEIKSPSIDFDDGSGPAWGELSWRDIEPGASSLLYQLEYVNGSGAWELIPDSALTGNAAGLSTSPVNLELLNTTTYNEIRIVGELNCSGANCPTLNEWTLAWSRGFSISGTALEYDGVSSTTGGTVGVAVNGAIQIGKTGTIQSNGTWTIDDVTFFSGDVVTVFVTGASDTNEAVAVTKYDGTPDISGMRLQKRHLTIGSDDYTTITNANIGEYDFTDTEDIFFDVSVGSDLSMCADATCGDAGIVVLPRNTYAPGTGADVTTHDFRNNGTFTAGSNSIRLTGSWDNNATSTMTGSTLIFTATSSIESIDETGSITGGFNNVTFGETNGSATWTPSSALTIAGNLSVTYGTLSRGTTSIAISGNLTTGANGYWSGIGTTTFDGTNPGTWTDNNATKQNIGNVVVDGTSKTLLLGSNATMQSLTIGANDTFDLAVTGFTASIYENWVNNNTFTARTGTVNFIATTTNRTITVGGSSFYNLTFSGIGGSWSFTGADLSVTNDLTIATGTVTLPTGTTTLSGSFVNSGGTFAHNNGVVLMNASAAETLTLSGTAFANAFYNLRFAGTGSWSFTEAQATTSNDFTITQGSVTLPSATLTIGGNFINSGGTFAHNSGTVRFTASGARTIDTNASFNSLAFTTNGTWSFIDTNVTALGSITIASGTVTLPSGTLTLGGSYTNSASVAHNNGTVLFNSTDAGETVVPGASSFYNMTFTSATGGWTIANYATTSNNFTLSTTSSFTLASGIQLSVGGVFTNAVGGASTTWTGSTLSLESGAYSLNTKTNTGDLYGTLLVKANTDIKMWNSSSTVYSVDSTGSVYSQDHSGADGDLYIFGGYERASSTEYWSYATDFDGTALGGSSRQVDVRFASGASATFSSSTLSIVGTSTATTTIANQGSGTYLVNIYAGTTTAQYYDFSDLGSTGVTLASSTKVTTLSDGRYGVATVLGTGLTVASSTIDANPQLQIYRVTFSTTTAISAFNVTQTGGAPLSYWWFRESLGNIDGEAFDSDTGDPGSIRWDDSSLTITVSGRVYGTDESTALGAPTCGVGGTPVRIVIEGGATYDGACDGSGNYSIPGVVIIGDPTMTVFLNGAAGGERAVTVTKTPTADITNLDLIANRVIVRHEDVDAMTIADMAAYDVADDADIPFTAATGTADVLTVHADNELHIWATSTFTPGGTVTVQSGGTGNTYDGSLHIDNAATFTGAGTTTYSVGGILTQDTGAHFVPASSTVAMTATTSGKAIVPATGELLSFNELQFTGVGGAWNINGNASATANIYVATGTVTGTGNITLMNGSLYGNGLVSLGTGTTTVLSTNTLGGTQAWTFGNLVVGNGSVVGTTTRATNATTTILGKLTIAAGHYLAAGGAVWNFEGSGNVFVETGTFVESTSTVVYSGTAGTNVISTNYYNLAIRALGSSPTHTATGLGIVVQNDLTVGGTATATLSLLANDPALDVNGNVTIQSNGILIASNSAAFTVGGSWDTDGVFTGSGGTVTFDSAGTKTIASGNASWSNVVVNGAGVFTVTESATATASFTITNATTFAVSSGATLAVGGTFANNLGGAGTDWTGSTLALYGGGNYQINASTTNDAYGTLFVAANTDIRMWNSSAASMSIDSTGSLYSQDHGNSDGALYVFGEYVKTSGTDYWSYATDFDGTILSGGSRRKVTVSFASSSSAVYTGGGLSVIGDALASTTIENQGAGTYGLRVGGTASTSMSYYELRDMNASGLIFSGSPTVVTLSFGDIEVSQPGGSGITVGGSAINQNPAKTFTGNYFATSTGIAGFNVTATGTTVSSWRFTNHAGSLDGESYDVDPDGDPGYIVWDDSAALVSFSGHVYSDEGSTVSGFCDGSTSNIHLRVQGLTSYTTDCDGLGAYTFTGVTYSPGDSLVVYIDGETENGAVVTEDPVTSISNLDVYENRVIVRHEGADPLSIADMALWDSSDDADIPFTAVDSSPDTLTLPADTKLVVWGGKTFEPGGNVTLSGGGSGAAYDGTLELFANAEFTAQSGESHSVGGSLISGSAAVVDASTATFTFTTPGASRTIDTNDGSFYNLTLNGAGSWTVTNSVLTVANDLVITSGALTVPVSTTTIAGSFQNTGGTFVQNGGQMLFTATGAETIRPGGSDFGTTTFNGTGSWTYQGAHATTTGDYIIQSGTVTAATGTITIGGDFVNRGIFTHNNGALRFISNTASTSITASTSDLYGVTIAGSGSFYFTDTSAALRGSLSILSGALRLATGTLSIAGSFLNTGGSFDNASGTILFNSADTGEIVNSGASPFHNVSFANAGGGWTLSSHATATGNVTLGSATSFTLASSTRLYVAGVFTNTVGGAATTWSGSTLVINTGAGYTVNTKTTGGDVYGNVIIGSSTALRMWDSSESSLTLTDVSSSLYSQDHAGVSGSLYIFGNYVRASGSDYWSYATDFDGTALGGSSRLVQVYHAAGATTTLTGGTLNIVGASGFVTTINNQGSGTYGLDILGGTLNAQYYSFANMGSEGLNLDGLTTITSLSQGAFSLAVSGGSLITLASTTLNYNAGLTIVNTSFATTTAITGYNVNLVGTTPTAWTFVGHTGNFDGEYFDNDGIDDCGSLHWDDSLCLLTQQSAYRWRNDDGGEGVPDSEWFDLDWTKRKRVTLTNADAVTYTNAAIKLTVAYDADMQADFDDLRFTDDDGITPTEHFIESYTASDEAVVWVKVPTIATSTTASVYMYYGEGTVSDTSATTTFSAMDDFEDNSNSEYSGDTGEFIIDTAGAYERTHRLEAFDPANGKTDFGGMYNNSMSVSQGEKLRFFKYIDTGTGFADEVCTLFGTQNQTQNYGVCLELFGVDRMSLARNVLHRDTSGTVLASTTVTYSTGWYEVEVDWGTDDSIFVTLFKDGSQIATTSATDGNYTSGGIGYTLWGYHGGWDVYSARPLLTNEPTVSFGFEQVSGGATWIAALNTAGSGVNVGDIARVRFLIENTGNPITNQNFEIEFAPKGVAPSCESVNFATYAEVPNVASCGTSEICMETSSYFTNLASTTDVLGGEGVFTQGQIVEDPSNNTSNISIDSDEFTELEYTITPTINVTDSNYCFRVSNEGTDLDAYTSVAELSLVFAPNITSLSLNGGVDINLYPGTTTRIYATGTISDLNGYADIADATTTLFRSDLTEACAADANNCYHVAAPLCSYYNCAGNSCDITCSIDMYYHADPTDIGTYAGETWRALLAVEDQGGVVATATAPSVDLITLRAISVDDTINYGALEVNADTGSYNASTTLENIGNGAIDISIEGTDLTDGGASTIPVTTQYYATSTFTYSACVTCNSLSSSAVNYEIDLAKPTSTTPSVTDELFWGIAVPFGVSSAAHQGSNTFYAISD